MSNLDNTPNTENASLELLADQVENATLGQLVDQVENLSLEELADQIMEAITRGHPKPLLRILGLCSRLLKPRQLALLKQIVKEKQQCTQTQ